MSKLPTDILIIDDDSTVGQSIEGPLAGYNVVVSNSQDLETAMYLFNNQDFDVIFVELEFEALRGLALVQKFREHDNPEKRAAACVMMSGKTRPPSDDVLMKELLDIEIIVKPFNLVKMLPYLSRGYATKQKRLKFEVFRSKIRQLVKDGKAKEAMAEAHKNVSTFGKRGIELICEIYERCEQYQEGLNFINPLAEKDPDSIIYQYLRGRFLNFLGDYDKARELLESAYGRSPHRIDRLRELANLYLNVKAPDDAVAKMKEIIKLCPEDPNQKFTMYDKLDDAGFHDHAKKLSKETATPKEIIRHYNNKGIELSKVGDYEGAIVEYERAISYNPGFKENYRIYYNIALAKIKMKKKVSYQEAAECLKKCLELNPIYEKAKVKLDMVENALAGKKKAS